MKKLTLPILLASITALTSCDKKPEEVKKTEEATAKAVEAGTLTKEQAAQINEAAEKAVEVKEEALDAAAAAGKITEDQADKMKEVQANPEEFKAEAKKLLENMLTKLDSATTGAEMKAAIKEATQASTDYAVKTGALTEENAKLALSGLGALDLLPDEQIKSLIDQTKEGIKRSLESIK